MKLTFYPTDLCKERKCNMQKYIIECDIDIQKTIMRIRKRMVKKINSIFDNCQHNKNLMESVSSFLISCGTCKYYENLNITCNSLFSPSLENVDFEDVYEKIQRNLTNTFPKTLSEYMKSGIDHYFSPSDKYVNFAYYLEDYSTLIIEARINSFDDIIKVSDEDIDFLCRLVISEYLSKLNTLDNGKCDFTLSVRKRLTELIDDNDKLENELKKEKEENSKLRNKLYFANNKKEKVRVVTDNSKIIELNRDIRKKDMEIETLKKRIDELSAIHTIVDNKQNDDYEIDFDKKFVFIGGCFNTVNQLKNLFQNAYFYDNENEIDKFVITSDDVIIVYLTDFMSHSTYYKVRNMCEKTKQIHCSNSNIVRILDTISANI